MAKVQGSTCKPSCCFKGCTEPVFLFETPYGPMCLPHAHAHAVGRFLAASPFKRIAMVIPEWIEGRRRGRSPYVDDHPEFLAAVLATFDWLKRENDGRRPTRPEMANALFADYQTGDEKEYSRKLGYWGLNHAMLPEGARRMLEEEVSEAGRIDRFNSDPQIQTEMMRLLARWIKPI